MNGDRVAWFMHKHPVVAELSTEAEDLAVFDNRQDWLNVHHFLNEFM